ncbi:hypothetical protein Tco_1038481 [Tanacetum coccineum]
MIGSLMYLTANRPNIQFSTCLCARYQANPKESHLVSVKRIFRYLKGTLNLGLWYPKGSGFNLKAYSDSDYAGCNLDRKSTSGGCQILGGKLVCWSAKKQSSVAMSSAEAEYVVAAGYHFIRDHILKGDIKLHFVPTEMQLTDIFTKPLADPSFTRLVAELAMLNIEKVDIGNIIFSDLVAKLQDGKKGREPNVCYTMFLSLMIEHLLAASFKKALAYEVALTSHMLKVAKLSTKLEETLIISSKKVNTDDIADKSLSEISVQSVI